MMRLMQAHQRSLRCSYLPGGVVIKEMSRKSSLWRLPRQSWTWRPSHILNTRLTNLKILSTEEGADSLIHIAKHDISHESLADRWHFMLDIDNGFAIRKALA